MVTKEEWAALDRKVRSWEMWSETKANKSCVCGHKLHEHDGPHTACGSCECMSFEAKK